MHLTLKRKKENKYFNNGIIQKDYISVGQSNFHVIVRHKRKQVLTTLIDYLTISYLLRALGR